MLCQKKYARAVPLVILLFLVITIAAMGQSPVKRLRDYGLFPGVLPVGPYNAITDVAPVRVGHVSLIEGNNIRTGLTVVIPHPGNMFQDKVPAAVFVGNGFGKLMGSTQIAELGSLETPIVLTNTLSVPEVAAGLIEYTLALDGNDEVGSVNPVVGETNDGRLNDIRRRAIRPAQVLEAIDKATVGPVPEGNVGAGVGTVCFGFKGGIGTSSRRLPVQLGGYTVGVLVQSNFGGVLQMDGLPVGKLLDQYYLKDRLPESANGSCMIIIATDAPVEARNLKRMAARSMMGLARTGGIASNGSGDYAIAFSTHPALRMPHRSDTFTAENRTLRNDAMSMLFLATIEATEEAILNSLVAAETMTGNGQTIQALPMDTVGDWLQKYRLFLQSIKSK